jgi:hypothetical protein
VVDSILPLGDAAVAHERIEKRAAAGEGDPGADGQVLERLGVAVHEVDDAVEVRR